MNRLTAVLKAAFSRRWLLGTLIVLVTVAVFIRLGIWQLDRLEQRRAGNEALAAALDSPPVDLNEAGLTADPAALEDRYVTVSGEYDLEQQMILRLQNWQGRPGVHLITPLLIEGRDTAVLVDRGWIPEADTDNLAQFDETGPVTVDGYFALAQTLSRGREDAADGPRRAWFRVDVDRMQAQLPYDILPLYVIQSPVEEFETTPPLHTPRQVDLSDGPHFSYAMQWFLFALIVLVGYVLLVDKSLRPSASPAAAPETVPASETEL